MDKIHYISKDDPSQLVDEIGIIQHGYDPSGINDSLLLDLADSAERLPASAVGRFHYEPRQRD